MNKYTYFIDESGNSGDIVSSDIDKIEKNQPIFTLACIGVHDETDLDMFAQSLIKKYRIQSQELKSKNVLKKQDKIPLDIVNYLKANKGKVLIECVNKKFQICTQLVTYYVLGLYSGVNIEKIASEDPFILSAINSLFYRKIDKEAYSFFSKSFLSAKDDIDDINACFNYFMDLTRLIDLNLDLSLDSPQPYKFIKENCKIHFHELVKNNRDIFLETVKKEGKESAKKRFLPLPDITKSNKYSMLPNYNCITNILARINKMNHTRVKIYHDEQHEFKEVIENAVNDIWDLSCPGSFKSKYADFNLLSKPDLYFIDSKSSFGIQFADILSGLVRFVILNINNKNCHISSPILEAFSTIDSEARSDFGINYLLDAFEMEKINELCSRYYF